VNLGQFPLSGGSAGILCTDPVLLAAGAQTIVLPNAMGRPPDLALVRATNVVTDNSWTQGESFHLYQSTITAPGFVVSHKPGLLTLYTAGGALTGTLKSNPSSSFVLTAGSWKLELIAVWFAIPASQ
jgi:hypothetical protein